MAQGASSGNLIDYPTGLVRSLLRLPLLLYRLGLGALLDPLPIMILGTRGHRSGLPRYTPIEFRRHGSKFYLVSLWGTRPHWYRNLLAEPRVIVQHGRRVFPARARPVDDPGEALRVLHLFRRRLPAVYDPVLAKLSGRDEITPGVLPEVTDEFTIVRLDRDPESPPALPPLRADLAWVLPATFALSVTTLALLLLARTRRAYSGR